QAVLAQRVRLEAEERIHASGHRDTEHELVVLTRASQQEQAAYNKRLMFLQQSRKLIEQQLPRLVLALAAERLDGHFARAREQVEGNRLGLGMPNAVAAFFQGLRTDLGQFRQEAETTQLLVNKLYERYTLETGATPPPVPRFDAGLYLRELDDLEAQAAPYKNRLGSLLASQQKVFERFFDTLAREAGGVYGRAREEGERWCKQALAPLMQQTLESKKRIEAMAAKLERLRSFGDNRFEQTGSIREQRESLREQQTLLEDILGRIREQAPA
ncbi:MAG: hypothetical protein ACK4UT_04270, partial [Moraxellaceae bacterium]